MRKNEELAMVVSLAILTEHRTNAEQRALLALAWECDKEHNAMAVTNRARRAPDWRPQNLVAQVLHSRALDESDGDKEVGEPKGWVKRWVTWAAEDPTVAAYILERPTIAATGEAAALPS